MNVFKPFRGMSFLVKCRHYGVCGGCQLQHLPYREQVELKVSRLEKLFGFEPHEVYESPRRFYYRNRMDYVVGPGHVVGLKERGKWWRYVDLEECLLMSREADLAKNVFREFIKAEGLEPWDAKAQRGFVRYLVIREGKFTGERMCTVVTFKPMEERDYRVLFSKFLELLEEKGIEVTSLYWGLNPYVTDVSYSFETRLIHGAPLIRERLLGNTYLIGVNSFFQSNPYTAELLVKKAVELLEPDGGKVYDLYCGVGTFSVEIGKHSKVVCVDSESEAIELLRENMRLNDVEGYEALNVKVERLRKLDTDKVLLDPPRSGLHPKAVRLLARSKPKTVVYVSCNPKTQKRDITMLSRAGYKLEHLIFIDQFPQTEHMETIALLRQ
ncbi:23S rRNA (uracil(1939)-C(5))-methyltransferase RlmD [Candidatus Bathyarchaeota archaeon]|nr:23S rRNA (uracil(1939)-C(5))-methyltransferase RlmD [Candidatus Bathyarchaeota archaeon]